MQLLHYETIECPEGSYNGLIKKLVLRTRYYYSEVIADEFKNAMPELRQMEEKIQFLDREFGNQQRDYLNEIILELDEETDAERLFNEEIERTGHVLIKQLEGSDFDIKDFSYDFANHKGINIVEFYGYRENQPLDTAGLMFKDIMQSIAYKYKIIFIDSSKSGWN